jgi:hypothetical protein
MRSGAVNRAGRYAVGAHTVLCLLDGNTGHESVQECLGASIRGVSRLTVNPRTSSFYSQTRKNPPGDANLIMLPYPVFNFDPDASTFVGVADIPVIDLQGVHGLDQIGLLTLDVNQITHIDFAAGQFDDPNVYSRVVVSDAANKSFSYSNGHNEPPILKRSHLLSSRYGSPSLYFDSDLFGFCLFGLGEADFQNSIFEVGFCFFRLNLCRKLYGARENAVTTF